MYFIEIKTKNKNHQNIYIYIYIYIVQYGYYLCSKFELDQINVN